MRWFEGLHDGYCSCNLAVGCRVGRARNGEESAAMQDEGHSRGLKAAPSRHTCLVLGSAGFRKLL